MPHHYGKTPPSTKKGRKIAKKHGGPIHYGLTESRSSVLDKHEKREAGKYKNSLVRSLLSRGITIDAMKTAEAPIAHIDKTKRLIRTDAWRQKIRRAGRRIGAKK